MPLAEGDMGGVNGEGDMTDIEEGEPGNIFIAAANSIAEDELERGDGTAEPVETYNGRSSSAV